MEDYKKFLAEQILTEDKVVCVTFPSPEIPTLTRGQVSYRLLSRAMKVHVNTAKQYVPRYYPQKDC